MLAFAIACNLLITILNLYIAWKIWRLRQVLARVTAKLNLIEYRTYYLLCGAPRAIITAQQETSRLKIGYEKLTAQLQQMQKLLQLLTLAMNIWRYVSQPRRGSRWLRKLSK